MIVPVSVLLGRPSEDVESEIRVRLGLHGVDDVGWGETRFEVLDPGFELFFKRSSGSGWMNGVERGRE